MCFLGVFYLLIKKLTSKTKFDNEDRRSIEVQLPYRFGKGKKIEKEIRKDTEITLFRIPRRYQQARGFVNIILF